MFAYVLCKQRMFYVSLPNALKLVKQGGMVLGNKEGICGLLIATTTYVLRMLAKRFKIGKTKWSSGLVIATEKARNARSARTMFPILATLIM